MIKEVRLNRLLIFMLIVFSTVSLSAQSREDRKIEKGLARVASMMELIQLNHYEDADPVNLIDSAIGGMLQQLDPHSSYMTSEQTRTFTAQQQGEYSGVGMTVGTRNGEMTVISPMEDSPAARQGLRTGDLIKAIDGVETSERDYLKNVEALKGSAGSKVILTIERANVGTFEVEITRARISLHTVRYAFMINDEVGYIRLTSFAQTSDAEVSEAISSLQAQGMKKLVFDLRGNPGGDLDAAAGVANQFIPDGKIVYTRGMSEQNLLEFRANPERSTFHGPLVVLQNNGSASGSEVVAGALQDHDRAWIVGDKSWGKGLVQSRFMLQHGASLSLTTAKYYTPSGRLIQKPYTPGQFDNYFNPLGEESQDFMQEAKTVHLNRSVFGGNGIAPDTEVKTPRLTDLTQEILLRGLIFDFVTDYLSQHSNIDENYRANDQDMANLKKFVQRTENLDFDQGEWETDYDFLKARITLDVLTRNVNSEAAFRAIMMLDNQLVAALKSFKEAENLLNQRLKEKH